MSRIVALLTLGAVAALPALPADAGGYGTQYAFLVGCSKYRKAEFRELPYTGNDVLGFRDALLTTGFAAKCIAVLHDDTKNPTRFLPTRANILRELDLLLHDMKAEDTVVIALSGHGVQFKGDPISYFVPIDAEVSDKATLVALDGPKGLFAQLKACKATKKLLIVNACRNDPAVSAEFASKKVELVDEDRDEVPVGIAALYSCKAGQKSYYDPERKLALFFDHVIRAWKGEYDTSGKLTLEKVFHEVAVRTKTDAYATLGVKQSPVVKREYKGEWAIAKTASAKNAKAGLDYPKKLPGVDPKDLLPAAAENPLLRDMKFVRVPRGTFWMSECNKKAQMQVTIEKDFELAAYPVTQEQWEAVMGENPSWYSRNGGAKVFVKSFADGELKRFPVERVSWEDAQMFLKKLNAEEKGKGWLYRLPTEAEWEYACRGGATTKAECSFDFYLDRPTNDLSSSQANFNGDLPYGNGVLGPNLQRPTKVGSYPPNKLGLYDMHGNVWQWCEDLYRTGGIERVVRGGAWNCPGHFCRAAVRLGSLPSDRTSNLGLRLVRVPSGE